MSLERLSELPLQRGSLGILGLGQSGVILRGPSQVLCIDPYLTDSDGSGGSVERNFPPPLQPEELAGLDWVLVSHPHLDHFDPQTLRRIAQAAPQCRFLGPPSCDFALAGLPEERVLIPEALEDVDLGDVTLTVVPAAHPTVEPMDGSYGAVGFLVELNGVTFYHTGDTVIFDAHEASGTPSLLDVLAGRGIDILFAPINGRDWFRSSKGIVGNTNAREAVELAEELDVGLVIPHHYDLIPGNTVNPAHFVDMLYSTNPARRHHLLRPGELFVYVRE